MRIFLAAPFTGKIDPATQLIEQSYRVWLESIIQDLESEGHSVTGAHIREHWGAKLEPPEVAIQNDFNSVRECDLAIAYLGNPPSPGVQMELGFAIAFKKPIIIIHEKQSTPPYLVKGIRKLTLASEIAFTDRDQLLKSLRKKIGALKNRITQTGSG